MYLRMRMLSWYHFQSVAKCATHAKTRHIAWNQTTDQQQLTVSALPTHADSSMYNPMRASQSLLTDSTHCDLTAVESRLTRS